MKNTDPLYQQAFLAGVKVLINDAAFRGANHTTEVRANIAAKIIYDEMVKVVEATVRTTTDANDALTKTITKGKSKT